MEQINSYQPFTLVSLSRKALPCSQKIKEAPSGSYHAVGKSEQHIWDLVGRIYLEKNLVLSPKVQQICSLISLHSSKPPSVPCA